MNPRFSYAAALALSFASLASARADDAPGHQALHPPIPYDVIETRLQENRARLGFDVAQAEPARSTFGRLLFPIRARANAEPFRVHHVINYVDHDAYGPGFLRDFECGRRTYDLPGGYDHAGIDYSYVAFQDFAMDESWGEVIAAAGGVIIDWHDGEPDRNGGGRNESLISNYVIVRHDDGIEAFYYHLANGSLTRKQVGDRVEQGEYIGLIGSSGTSAEPHLHFQMHHPALFQRVVDPYGGPCSNGPDTIWQHQHGYLDPAITAMFTHSRSPYRPPKYTQDEVVSLQQVFAPGDEIFFSYFLRDQAYEVDALASVIDPAGNTVEQHAFSTLVFPSLSWNHSQFSWVLPDDAPAGVWRYRGEFEGDIRERAFYVSMTPEPGARLGAALLPASRSVRAGSEATVFATVVNNSAVTAQGCWIGPGAPFRGRFRYRQTDPASNAAVGAENRIFDLPAGGSRSFVLSFTPDTGAEGTSFELPIRYKCDNGDAARILPGVNSVLLSFGAESSADLIAIAVTPSGDGILRLADANTNGAFAAAVANVGADGELTLRPSGTGAAAGLDLVICETDTASGACLGSPAQDVTRIFAAGETASFAVFARPQGESVAFSPATTRIRVEALDGDSIIRGATSVAVRTD
ncbi:peptidoglycan DD-metalloendopeptidase family protein [Hyphobacterium sp.]|uniref:peptidoglycan DD-metalloendopeptidase family protein n=1 Tax=Hyphobacterium sp. TaxID=2004662 RepID=UPI003B5276E1